MKKILISLFIIICVFLTFSYNADFAKFSENSADERVKESEKDDVLNLHFESPSAPCGLRVSDELCVDAKSAYLLDEGSGEVVFSKNCDQRLTIASMTKIMLLNLVFDAIDNGTLSYDEELCVSEKASSMGGSQVFLQAGGNYKIKDLIKSVIIASANDASVALSEKLFGSEDACVAVMNEKKQEWGMANTLFSNVTGLPRPTQYSSAKDVAIMLKKLLQHKDYFDFSGIWLDELVHPDGQKTTLTNTNKLVRFYNGCDGGKTGFTTESKYCLASTAKRGDMRVIAVVIGEENSKQRFDDVRTMFDYVFNNYECKEVVSTETELNEKLEVKRGKELVKIAPSCRYTSFMKKGESYDYTYDFYPCENLQAPIEKGQKMGEIIIYKNSVEVARIDAVALNFVGKRNLFDSIKQIVKNWTI